MEDIKEEIANFDFTDTELYTEFLFPKFRSLPDDKKEEFLQCCGNTAIKLGQFRDFIDFWNAGRNIEYSESALPEIISLSDYNPETPPQVKTPVIHGVLRKGHKMMISGASKTGKSFLAIELAIAIAMGGYWLEHKCTQGKVLYLNLEIEEPSFLNRIIEVTKQLGKKYTDIEKNIDIWNLRGYTKPLTDLENDIVNHCIYKNYDIIIINPLYKVLTGDENGP